MKTVALLWAGLLAFAPATAACACPASPTTVRMGCEGTSDCCCGETPSSDVCPRSEAAVDTLDQPLAPPAPVAAPDVLTFPFVDLTASPVTSPCAREEDDARARASPSRPLYLRCSVFLL